MNWISNVVPPKIRSFLRRETPENLWVKCPDSGELVFHKDLEANLQVVPGSGYHMKFPVKQRLDTLFDEARYEEIATPDVPQDPLKFRDMKRYTDRLKEYRVKTGSPDAIKLAAGAIEGIEVVVAVQNFEFAGGLARHGCGRGDHHRHDGGDRSAPAVHHLHRIRRCAHAGRHVLFDADAAHDASGAAPARGEASVYRRFDQPDDRRRHGLLRDAGRRPHRRARRGDRVRRCPRHRADDPRAASRRVPARGIPAEARHGRHGRGSARTCARRWPTCARSSSRNRSPARPPRIWRRRTPREATGRRSAPTRSWSASPRSIPRRSTSRSIGWSDLLGQARAAAGSACRR